MSPDNKSGDLEEKEENKQQTNEGDVVKME